MMKALGIMLAFLALSGCLVKRDPDVVTRVQVHRLQIPKQLLTCMPEPEAKEVWRTQKDVALYLVRISEAGEDCRQKLDGVRRLVESQQ